LEALISKLNNNFPDELNTDWRRFVRSQFHTTPDQEQSFDHIPTHVVKEIQDFFRQASQEVKRGGHLHAKIVKRPKEKQTPSAVHEVHVGTESAALTPQLSIVIAHCDAHCRNWGWGPG
jgi:hypothetical protein